MRVEEHLLNKPRFLTREALAEFFGVSPRRIKTWRERGLPGRKIGRDVMFDPAEVEAWIDRQGIS